MKKFLFLLALVLHGTCSAQWTQILPTSSVGTFTYYDMSVLAGANGNDTIFVAGTAGAGKPRLYRSYDGGTTWTSLPFFNYNPNNLSELQSVVAFRSGVVLVSGSNINGEYTYRSTDWGQTWNDAETKYNISVGGFSEKWGPNEAYAVASTPASQWGFTKDEGLTYTLFQNTLGQWAGSAPYLTDSIFYIRKSDGCVYKTTNQAQAGSWQQLICNVGTGLSMNGHFFNADTGIWCSVNLLIITNNGGITWDTIPISGSLIHFFNRNKGMVCGNQVSFSDDGGITWLTDTAQVPIGTKVAVYRTQNSAYILNTNTLYKKNLLTSLDILAENTIEINPNPTSKIIYFQKFKGDEIIEIYDFESKKVYSGKIEKEIDSIKPGNYKIIVKDKTSRILISKTIVLQ